MRSMTGFGRGEAEGAGIRCHAEATSVNRKQLEVICTLPPGFGELEREIRILAHSLLSRGHVRIAVEFEDDPHTTGGGPAIDRDRALHYVKEIHDLAAAAGGQQASVDLVSVLGLPGVLAEPKEGDPDIEKASPFLKTAIESALAALVVMREQEGQHLREDLAVRINEVRAHVTEIGGISGGVVEAQKKRLFARLEDSGISLDWEDERLAREIALFAERCDVSEELVRLESHFLKFEEMLAQPDPAGRSLDFLAQEIFRELNTITSKGSDAGIAHHAVAAKTEVERIREQVQNVE